MLRDAARLREIFPINGETRLIFNDRPDLALLAGFDGVHVGQGDVSAEEARKIVSATRWVGVSTNSAGQVMEADKTSCDYIAYGPIFPTASKANPNPTVGLAGLRAARALTAKPLVAIGGITRKNCHSVLDAGADSLAVISDLFPGGNNGNSDGESARQIIEEFLALLG
jgi:thiamine-phosphate pyrophosphorylase